MTAPSALGGAYAWQWPSVGATPVSQGLDTEIFDSEESPSADTLVREAIQNSLDARHDRTRPVRMSVQFKSGSKGTREPFLTGLKALRARVSLPWPEEWERGEVSWLTISDTNTTGLQGDVDKRSSDFWGYWLNFGVSNKDGRGRGSKGIGRVTFLIASQVQTVIGVTRRIGDRRLLACGMGVLRPMEDGDDYRSTHAYLAAGEHHAIYKLHESEAFTTGLMQAFGLEQYSDPNTFGLGLVVPYPFDEIDADGVVASAIEHFAPAIMDGSLEVAVDDAVLSRETLHFNALRVSDRFTNESLRKDPDRFLDFVRLAQGTPDFVLDITRPVTKLSDVEIDAETMESIRQSTRTGKRATIRINGTLKRSGTTSPVHLSVVVGTTPDGYLPIDCFFREGMCLPRVRSSHPGSTDTLMVANDVHLATYLNFCEGKAHLDLQETREVKQKLLEKGYGTNLSTKKFVKSLPHEIRAVLHRDQDAPDPTVFANFFSIPKVAPDAKKQAPKQRPDLPPGVQPPPPDVPACRVETTERGFRVVGNPKYLGWPIGLTIEVAYANGSAKPKWSPFDFKLDQLTASAEQCEFKFQKNVVELRDCKSGFHFELHGFDNNRELVTFLRVRKHAQAD